MADEPAKEIHYHPYENAPLDAPLFHLLLRPCLPFLRPVLEGALRLRWLLARPLEVRVLPKALPTLGFPSVGHITVGDVLLTLPLAVFFLASYSESFVLPSVEGSGEIASFAIYWTFLTANKANNLISFFFGIPFERLLPHHLLASHVALILGAFHVYVSFAYGGGGDGRRELLLGDGEGSPSSRHLSGDSGDETQDDSEYALGGTDPNFFKFLFDGGNNTSGSILFICMALLIATSFFRIFRKHLFELWLASHILLAVSVVVFCVIHEVISILYVALWWAVDLLGRYLIMAACRYPTSATIRKIQPDVCEVRFEKPRGFSYNPGQFVQIAVREVSAVQFHPVSISSAPHEDFVTLHVRGLGGWSRELAAMASSPTSGDEGIRVSIFVEGPYGSLSVDVDNPDRYKHVVLVCGGIGVTHCQSVGKALQYQARVEGRPLQQMRMIWAVRDLAMVRDMPPLGDAKLRRIKNQNKDAIISKEVYCTTRRADAEDPPADAESSLPRGVKLRTHRPDLDKILREVKDAAIESGEMNIAVFGCGPDALIDSLKEACREHSMSMGSCGGVFFDLHVEHFNF